MAAIVEERKSVRRAFFFFLMSDKKSFVSPATTIELRLDDLGALNEDEYEDEDLHDVPEGDEEEEREEEEKKKSGQEQKTDEGVSDLDLDPLPSLPAHPPFPLDPSPSVSTSSLPSSTSASFPARYGPAATVATATVKQELDAEWEKQSWWRGCWGRWSRWWESLCIRFMPRRYTPVLL